MTTTLILAVPTIGALWLLWRVFGAYLQRSPLDNVPGPERTSFLRGNISDIFDRHGWQYHDRLANEFPAVAKYHGPFGTRGLYVSDPKALNNVIVKEQHIYEEPRWFLGWLYMTFGPGLLSTIGDHHRRQRKMLNPVFSIAHMRGMTPLFYRVIHRLRTAVENEVGNTTTEIDLHNWMARTALELVGQGGLGYSFDPLTSNTRNAYGDAIKAFIPLTFKLHYYRILLPLVRNIGTPAFREWVADRIPSKDVQEFRKTIKVMQSNAKHIYDSKKTALEQGDKAVMHQIGEGKDIISILMKANLHASGEDKLPEEEVLGQMGMLLTAGTDTTTNALSRTFHLLAENQDIQDKIRAELSEAGPDGADIPYDTLVDLPLLDAVCRETLRLYSPVVMMNREVRQDVVMPLSEPIRGVNGQILNEIFVPKDTTVIIAIRACNRNKAIWGEDALEWKPERWLNKLPDSVAAAHVPGVYSHLMTFLGGGRACIGFKFSQLEMKVVLAVLLRTFRVHASSQPICWNIAGVSYPTVGPEAKRQAMPLRLEPLKTT
ncbi:cytochrome P450 [Irpex rosettiformis]|uniref:Cytochrome P450 n=1 Tax=Irpex rosettiformis TaxID=378272 RepID=A0ACB8UDZ7_9APHY|nr:cytochrome P450 [Irpex rosettiformis]